MNKTKIEWCDYTVNPVKGLCPVACPYCYARAMYKRFKWDGAIKYDSSVFMGLSGAKPCSKVFVGSTIDLFHPLCSMWNEEILDICSRIPEFTFIFLTKCPENLPKEFPDNCWVGVSITDWAHFADLNINQVQASIKFISFEPLLEYIPMDGLNLVNKNINWLIIGQQTPVKKETRPQTKWIAEIIKAANAASIPIFIKDNILSDRALGLNDTEYRQELPEVLSA